MSEDGVRKGGVAAGVLAAVGLGGVRLADNCVAAGARGARALDDVAIAGGRAGGRLADGAGGLGRGLDDLAPRGGPLGELGHAQGAGRAGARAGARTAAEVSEGGPGFEDLAEYLVDLGLEFASYDVDTEDTEELEAPESLPQRVAKPLMIDLRDHGWAWTRLADTGEGAESVPLVFVGQVDGDALLVNDHAVSLDELAATCWSRGAACVFVGCEGECVPLPQGVMSQIEAAHYREVETFEAQFVALMIHKLPHGLRFIAVSGGGAEPELRLVRAQRG